MPNIVLSVLSRDQSAGGLRSAASNLDVLQSKREAAARALVAANQREADSAGRVRVAEAQLAEARERYVAESSQVIRAEERLEASSRALVTAHNTAESASDRLEGAARRLASAEEEAARVAASSAGNMRSSWSGVRESVGRMVSESSSDLTSLAAKVTSFAGGIAKQALGTAAGFAIYDVGARAASAAYDVAKTSIVDFNQQLENADIGFTTMLGSGRKANALLNDLQRFAQRTPFQFADLTQYAQQMLGYGIKAKEILPDLKALGDAASGSGRLDALPNAVLAFEQIAARGRVDLQDVNQLTAAGVPALKILAATYHTTTAGILDMIHGGNLLASDALPKLRRGIEDGTKTTGAFGGMMAKQSKTFTGALSNIQDGLNVSLGSAFRPFFKVLESGAVQISKFAGSKEFRNWASDVAHELKPLLPDLRETGEELLPAVEDAATEVGKHMPELVTGFREALHEVRVLAPGISALIRAGGKLTGWLIDSGAEFSRWHRLGTQAILLVEGGFVTGVRRVIAVVGRLPAGLQKVTSTWGTILVDAGHAIIAGLIAGIDAGTGGALSTVAGLAAKVRDVFKLGIKSNSPSKVFHEIGTFITQGLAQGIQQGSADDVSSAMSDLVDKVRSGYGKLSDEVRTARETVKGGDARMDRLDDTAARLGRQKASAEDRLAAAKTDRQKRAAERALADIEDRQEENRRDRREERSKIADAKEVIRIDRSAVARKAAEGRALAAIRTTNAQLASLSAQRDALGEQLKVAQAKLQSAIDTRDSYNADVAGGVLGLGNISTRYGTTRDAQSQAKADVADLSDQLTAVQQQLTQTDVPDQVADLLKQRNDIVTKLSAATKTANTDPVQDLMGNLRQQISDANEFKGDLAQLKSMGLDDVSYKQLVDDYANGTGLDAARALLGAGADTVRSVASLQGQLSAASADLGKSTSSSLYQAGVDSAQGFVDGLNSQISQLTATMQSLADAMVASIKKQLGIKSPSTVFRAQGVYVTQGLVQGLIAGQGDVHAAVGNLVPTSVGVPNVAGGTTAGRRGRAGVHIENLNMTNGASAPELVAALDWLGRVGV